MASPASNNPFGDELYLHFVHDVAFALDVEGVGVIFADDVDHDGNILLPLAVDDDECDYQADLVVYNITKIEPNSCAASITDLDSETVLADLVRPVAAPQMEVPTPSPAVLEIKDPASPLSRHRHRRRHSRHRPSRLQLSLLLLKVTTRPVTPIDRRCVVWPLAPYRT